MSRLDAYRALAQGARKHEHDDIVQMANVIEQLCDVAEAVWDCDSAEHRSTVEILLEQWERVEAAVMVVAQENPRSGLLDDTDETILDGYLYAKCRNLVNESARLLETRGPAYFHSRLAALIREIEEKHK